MRFGRLKRHKEAAYSTKFPVEAQDAEEPEEPEEAEEFSRAMTPNTDSLTILNLCV